MGPSLLDLDRFVVIVPVVRYVGGSLCDLLARILSVLVVGECRNVVIIGTSSSNEIIHYWT
jgi:hypothetical protein